MLVASVILFLITTTMAKRKHPHSKDPDDNFFATVYVAIHSVVDDIFESMNLNTNFANATNSKLLLTMHKDLSNIADKTFEPFNDIQQTIKDNTNNQSGLKYLQKQTAEDTTKLDSIVKEILNQNHFNVYNAIKETLHIRGKDETKGKRDIVKNRKDKINPGLDGSEEFTEFLTKFLTKDDNFTLLDFKKFSRNGRVVVPSKRNLKIWDKPSTLIYDLDQSDNTRRIFKRSKTPQKYFPFIVSIHVMGQFFCSGSIISRDFVITAASCLNIAYKKDFFKENLKSIYVRLGSAYTSRDGETIPIQNVYFHPGYEPEHFFNNLAIIRLEKRKRFSRQQQRIRRILWDKTPGALSIDTKNIFMLGWGSTKEDQSTQELATLKISKLDVYNTDVCRKNYSEDFIRKENFCAALKGVNGSACSGDPGGPGIVGGVLVGVVSFGVPECGATGSPTVFTKVGYYVPWIESVVNAQHKINEKNYNNIDTRRKQRSKLVKGDKLAKINQFHGRIDKYPDDIKALRDTLMELVKPDDAVLADAIYGDNYDEFNNIFNNQHQATRDPSDYVNDNDDSIDRIRLNFVIDDEEEETPVETPIFDYISKIMSMESMCNSSEEMIPKKTRSYSEYDKTRNDAVLVDYTDNYEDSSKDNLWLSFKVPDFIKKIISLRNKKVVSTESESTSDRRNSDTSNDYSAEIKEFYVKNQKHIQKTGQERVGPRSV